jgi:hypothetical protein
MNARIKIKAAIWSLVFSLSWVVNVAGQTVFYVRSGNTSAGTGADWRDAFRDLPTSLVRGSTYYVADGDYSAHTFNDAASGTSVITIKKATIGDHGTDIGWNDTYGDGQATFAFQLRFLAPYYVLDGQIGNGGDSLAYGFKLLKPTDCSLANQHYFQMGTGSEDVSNNTFAHIAIVACDQSYDAEKTAFHMQGKSSNNLTLKYIYLENFQTALQSGGQSNVLIEHCWWTRHFSSSSHHGEWISFMGAPTVPETRCNNIVFRYNVITDSTGTGAIVANDNGNGALLALDGADIYGNVFLNNMGGNGIITATTSSGMANVRVYNNTFSKSVAGRWFCPVQSNAITARKDAATNNVALNNLVYSMSGALGDYGTNPIQHDYNAFYSCTLVPNELHGQPAVGDPFLSSETLDFRLSAATSAGIALPSPYDKTPNGISRESSGWTRGALPLANANILPSIPRNLIKVSQ